MSKEFSNAKELLAPKECILLHDLINQYIDITRLINDQIRKLDQKEFYVLKEHENNLEILTSTSNKLRVSHSILAMLIDKDNTKFLDRKKMDNLLEAIIEQNNCYKHRVLELINEQWGNK